MMDISISTTLFGASPLAECVEVVSAAGFGMVEISRKNKDRAKAAKVMQEAGVKVWSVHGSLNYGSANPIEEEQCASVKKEIAAMEEMAVYAPCPYVVHYLSRFNNPEAGIAFRRSMEQLVQKAEELKFNLSVETVPYKPEVNERYAKSREVADFVRSFASDFISVCVDLNHANLQEDLVDVAKNCQGLISNIHVSDNHGEREQHLMPGDGIIDFHKALKALRNAGYKGPLNLEVHLPDNLAESVVLKKLKEWADKMVANLPSLPGE